MTDSVINKNAWNKLADENIFLQFIDVTLRGCAQVMFQNNPLTGLFFFIAIFVGAFLENMPVVAFGCLLGTVVSTLTAYISKLDTVSLRAGLYGYNGCLVGVALPTFLENTPFVWLTIILGSIISVIATISLMDFLKNWKVAALTAPFVLVSWVILLASYSFLGIKGVALPDPALPQQYVQPIGNIPHSDLVVDVFRGISEVFLLSSMIVGVLFVIGLAVNSIWAAVFAVLGSLLAFAVATLLKGDFASIHTGLYSFSAVLTAIALGSTFNNPNFRVVVYAIVGVIFTVFVQGALDVVLEPFGIPTLTMPFVLASWLFLVPNQDLMPKHRQ
ncbi:urea transporter [Providencia sneebia]|uniref:Urea transporter n=1 Tax=Providencia sneebia DSM 19967 TaxID=1141660 RepID=K8WB49_9GAMM|nr:urea transporter [Providencia sneebia]EKT53435.1 urea transporter [Providencia sneebia DSM 19967]